MGKFEEAAELKNKYELVLSSIESEDIFALFQPIFQKYPQLRAAYWYQFTPSFNDGDPCTFTMGDFEAVVLTEENAEDLSGMSDEDLEDLSILSITELQDFSDWADISKIPGLEEDLDKAFGFISYDIAERVFGDDTQIVITKERITIRSYYCGY